MQFGGLVGPSKCKRDDASPLSWRPRGTWNVELWPEPVETQALLRKISAKISKYIVLRPQAVIATALWTMTAWPHEGTTHSPILAAISVEPNSGKSTLLGVLRFLVPKPFVSVEPTGPSVYRTVDREHPTLIIDEADDLFYRKSDLRAIVNAGWNSPWHEYRGRGPITKNQVAALLRDYDISPVVVHPTKRADFSRHGYRAAQFQNAFARFLPQEPNIRTLKSGRERM